MTIDINGNTVKAGFGLYFIGKAQEKYDLDLLGLLTAVAKHPVAKMVDLMWFSIQCEAELDEVEVPIKKRALLEHLENTKDFENEKGVIATWGAKFTESIRGNFIPEDEEIEEGEKKN